MKIEVLPVYFNTLQLSEEGRVAISKVRAVIKDGRLRPDARDAKGAPMFLPDRLVDLTEIIKLHGEVAA